MAYRITDNTPQVTSLKLQQSSIFLRSAAEEIVSISTPNTPEKSGRLRADVLKQVLGLKGKIEWRKNYAQYQERGSRADGSHVVRNYTTPGTGPNFAENAVKIVVAKTGLIAKRVGLSD
jgi:hypothetical protein